jgi:3-oxoacyl-[acyl-carrier protein] reductase
VTQTQQVVIIGGITGGIGSTLAGIESEKGSKVVGFARGKKDLDGLPDVEVESVEATDPSALKNYFDSIMAKHGKIDAYVHAIGSVLLKTVHTITDKEWRDTISINLDSAFYAARCVIPYLQKQENGGSLVYVSSVAAQAGIPAHEAIGAAKGGINGLVLSIASSYANRKIRCNAVAPGLVETPLTAGVIASPQARSISEKMHPLGQIGRPENVASLISWLISKDGDWVTGQIWSVDGGMAHVRQRPKA